MMMMLITPQCESVTALKPGIDNRNWPSISVGLALTGSAVITHDVITGTGYCLVGFNWIIDILN